MNLQRFFVHSLALHLFMIIAIIALLPVEKEKQRGREFFTSLVSPNELRPEAPIIKPRPGIRRIPSARPKASTPARDSVDSSKAQEKGGIMSDDSKSPPAESKKEGGQNFRGQGGFSHGTEGQPERAGILPKSKTIEPSVKEKLFDRSVIGDLAKRHVEKEEKKAKAFTFDTDEYRFLIYNQRLKDRIESIWVYPRDAAARGIYGDLVIKFVIRKNGTLGAVELVRTSGHKTLDDAAIRALREGSPYWPLPQEWGMEEYTIVGHFVYTLYGSYIL
jgi:protein TonB